MLEYETLISWFSCVIKSHVFGGCIEILFSSFLTLRCMACGLAALVSLWADVSSGRCVRRVDNPLLTVYLVIFSHLHSVHTENDYWFVNFNATAIHKNVQLHLWLCMPQLELQYQPKMIVLFCFSFCVQQTLCWNVFIRKYHIIHWKWLLLYSQYTLKFCDLILHISTYSRWIFLSPLKVSPNYLMFLFYPRLTADIPR